MPRVAAAGRRVVCGKPAASAPRAKRSWRPPKSALALDELGKVVGAVYTDDVLDRIFSRFCVGK